MKTNYERNLILDFVFGDGAYVPPATWYCGLLSAAPTVSTGGTEILAGGYARVAKTKDATNFPDAIAGQKFNGTPVAFPTATGDHPDATHFGWWDALTGGNLRHFAPLTTPKPYNTGDTPEFGVGQMTWLET